MAEIEAPRLAVCDAGPIIHLDELGCLDLLGDFGEVFVPEAVWREVGQHRPSALGSPPSWIARRPVAPSRDEVVYSLFEAFGLASGECEALILARESPGCILLTDDAAARVVAESLGLKVHGTIGVIVRALRRGQRRLEEVIRLIEAIPDRSTLHVRPALLAEVLATIRGESRA